MIPAEKAKELVEKFKPLVTTWDCYYDTPIDPEIILKDAKSCAVICVDEMLHVLNASPVLNQSDNKVDQIWAFYVSVKSEIEKL